jgi:hypothetical protein
MRFYGDGHVCQRIAVLNWIDLLVNFMPSTWIYNRPKYDGDSYSTRSSSASLRAITVGCTQLTADVEPDPWSSGSFCVAQSQEPPIELWTNGIDGSGRVDTGNGRSRGSQSVN